MTAEQFDALHAWIKREAQMLVLEDRFRGERFWGRREFEDKRAQAEARARALLVGAP
jgi:hypothetical protein